jgi:hypothetical protein
MGNAIGPRTQSISKCIDGARRSHLPQHVAAARFSGAGTGRWHCKDACSESSPDGDAAQAVLAEPECFGRCTHAGGGRRHAGHRLCAVDVAHLRQGRGYAAGLYASALPRMTYATKVVLHCPTGYHIGLDRLVEQFIADGVKFVGVVGHDCQFVEDLIDELVVGASRWRKPWSSRASSLVTTRVMRKWSNWPRRRMLSRHSRHSRQPQQRVANARAIVKRPEVPGKTAHQSIGTRPAKWCRRWAFRHVDTRRHLQLEPGRK